MTQHVDGRYLVTSAQPLDGARALVEQSLDPPRLIVTKQRGRDLSRHRLA